MRYGTPCSKRKQQLHVFNDNNEQRRGRACAPSFGNHLHWASQFLQAIESEPSKVFRIFVKWVTERYHEMNVASRRQYATDFAHDSCGITNVFEHRIALHTLKNVR